MAIGGIFSGISSALGIGGSSSIGSEQNQISNLVNAESKEEESIEQAASTAIGAMGDAAKTGATSQ